MKLIEREHKAAGDLPDILPLPGDEFLAADQHPGERAEADDVGSEHRPAGVVVDGANGRRERFQPRANLTCHMDGGRLWGGEGHRGGSVWKIIGS